MRYILCIFIALTLLSCQKKAEDESEGESPDNVQADVKVATVRSGDVNETVTASGMTTIRREAQLRSPMTGIIVHFPYFNGDKIASGATVAEIRSKESQAALQGAEALLGSATTEKQREEARQAVELAKRTSNTVPVRAPFAGVLTEKGKNETDVVAEGDQIATLLDPSSIVFIADIPAGSLNRIRTGQPVAVHFPSHRGKTYQGKVYRIEPQVNPGDQTTKVYIVFTNNYSDLEGSLFGDASITTGRKNNVLLVPASALLRDDEHNATSVMTVGKDSIAVHVPVVPGLRQDSLVQVSSPALAAGMRVVIEGHYGLPDSTRVKIIP